MPAKYDVPALNVKTTSLFEDSKSAFVRTKEAKKEVDRKIEEVNAAIADATKALESKDLSVVESKEVSRALDKLNITKNYLSKAVGQFDDAEERQKESEAALAKKRADKEVLINKRAKERAVRDENRKKAEAKK